MGKAIKIIIITILLSLIAPMAYAAVNIDDLLYRPGEQIGTFENEEKAEEYPELEAVGNLPDVSVEGAVTVAIKTVLSWTFIMTLVAFVTAGIYYIKSEGEEEQTSLAKRMILYLIIGMVVIAAAYGVVTGVAQFQFFR